VKITKSQLKEILAEELDEGFFKSLQKALGQPKQKGSREALPWPPPAPPKPPKEEPLHWSEAETSPGSFEALGQLTNLSIQVLLKQVDRDDLVLALIGAPQKLQDQILANVSMMAAIDIREEMQAMTSSYVAPDQPRARKNIPASRIRSAQQRIVDTVTKLIQSKTLDAPHGWFPETEVVPHYLDKEDKEK